MNERYAVYILASKKNGTLYIGVTGNLPLRVQQHASGTVPGFTQRYGVTTLVWFERHWDIHEAIAREKQLKGWNRRGRSSSSKRAIPSGWRLMHLPDPSGVIPGRSARRAWRGRESMTVRCNGSPSRRCAPPGMTPGGMP